MEREEKIEFLKEFIEYIGDFRIELVKNYEYDISEAIAYHMPIIIKGYIDGNSVEELSEKEVTKPKNPIKLVREFKKEVDKRIAKCSDRNKKHEIIKDVLKEFVAKGLNIQVSLD